MLENFSENQSLALRAGVLLGLLAWGAQDLNPNPVKAGAVLDAQGSAVESKNRPEHSEDTQFLDRIRAIFSTQLTPEEEAEICKEILTDVDPTQASSDPEGYMSAYTSYRDCVKDLSAPARVTLIDTDSTYAPIASHLMRCQEKGEDFDLARLEDCERVEEEWVTKLTEVLDEREMFIDLSYRTTYQRSDDQQSWLLPGYSFELDSKDGTEHGSYALEINFDGATTFIVTPRYESFDGKLTPDSMLWTSKNPQIITGDLIREYEEMTTDMVENAEDHD